MTRTPCLAAMMLVLLVASCGSPNPTATVRVVTSLVPGPEFGIVEVSHLSPAPLYEGATVLETSQTTASFGQDFVHGHNVATFTDLAVGEHLFEVKLLLADRTFVIGRRLRMQVTGDAIASFHLTRDCVGVSCPQPNGSPSLSECLAGRCVDERCAPPSTEFCAGLVFCLGNADCPAPSADCAQSECVEGICQSAPLPDACAASEFCEPASGCAPLPDAPDARVEDAGVDAGADAGALVCDRLCVLAGDPCRVGQVNCASGSPICEAAARQPVGTPCGAGFVCDAFGACIGCRHGESCSLGCEAGIIDCSTSAERCVADTSGSTLAVGTACSSTAPCFADDVCGEGSRCDSSGVCLASADGDYCSTGTGCGSGTISWASGGICVPDPATALAAGTGCGIRSLRDLDAFYTGYCDGAGSCTDCVEGAPCSLENACGAGSRSCMGLCSDGGTAFCSSGIASYEVGRCIATTFAAGGTPCVAGVCSGDGDCFEPLSLAHLGSGGHAYYSSQCGIRATGVVTCWDQTSTRDIAGIAAAAQVSGTVSRGCAVTDSGELWCWDESSVASRVALPGPASRVDVAFDFAVACVLLESKQLMCWGDGGSLGTGDGVDQLLPVNVPGMTDIRKVAMGFGTVYALHETGLVSAWGSNYRGRIGDGAPINWEADPMHVELSPVEVVGLSNVMDIAVSGSVCALSSGGEVSCWGVALGSGVFPSGSPVATTPQRLSLAFSDISDIELVSGGAYGALCMLRADGHEWCLGSWYGLGRGTGFRDESAGPGSIVGVSDIAEVANGCALRRDGIVFCWNRADSPYLLPEDEVGELPTTVRLP